MRDIVLDITDFKEQGFQALEDTTAAPLGALRIMRNAQVTRRGGIAPRPGTLLLGNANTSTSPVMGLYNFRKSFSSDELLVKAYGTTLEYISKDYLSEGWQTLQGGFTNEQEFGFVTSLVNTSNQDYLLGCNRYEPYFSWTGSVAQLAVALLGGETTITVDSTLLPDIYDKETTTSGNSTTTLVAAGANWATSQWVNFYVHITSGPQIGAISIITANTGTQVTFAALSGDPGLCTFEIRQVKFPATGSLIAAGNTFTYSAIISDTQFTTGSAPATPINTLVTAIPIEYPANPRGNRLANYLTRIVSGFVRAALARGSGGALQGYSAAGSAFVSKINNPLDFAFSAARVAGEGDIISMPYGGDDITDVQTQEDQFYVFKPRYIESIDYSQDANDLAERTPLKAGFGSIGKTIKGSDDIYFFTADKQITSIGRVQTKDLTPQTTNIGTNINRFLDNCGADATIGRGMQISNKLYFPIKFTPNSANNDILLILNLDTKAFEGIWDIPAFAIEFWNDEYYYGESNSPDVYQLFYEHADVRGDTRFPIDFEVESHYINATASKSYLQAMWGIVIEGYVAGGAMFDTSVFADFASNPFLTFNFSFDENAFLDGEVSQAFLGGNPLGTFPQAQVSYSDDLDNDGRRHFSFRVYFPYQYANYFAVGFSANAADNDFEVTRIGLIMKEALAVSTSRIKSA